MSLGSCHLALFGAGRRLFIDRLWLNLLGLHRPRPVKPYVQFPTQHERVRKTLVPALKAEGLRVCVDFECFEPGSFVVYEMERAVEQSRYTVSVLTPKYLESGFAEFEETLAQHLSLEERKKRYLGIMRESCEPSLSVRARYWLEMTDDDEYQINLPRLVQQLRQAP